MVVVEGQHLPLACLLHIIIIMPHKTEGGFLLFREANLKAIRYMYFEVNSKNRSSRILDWKDHTSM